MMMMAVMVVALLSHCGLAEFSRMLAGFVQAHTQTATRCARQWQWEEAHQQQQQCWWATLCRGVLAAPRLTKKNGGGHSA